MITREKTGRITHNAAVVTLRACKKRRTRSEHRAIVEELAACVGDEPQATALPPA